MYQFIREDNGEIVEVDFEKMMEQDAAGYIVLEDGVAARRVRDFGPQSVKRCDDNANHKPPVSDNLGVYVHQLGQFEEDRKKHGFTGVEFRPDPLCPVHYQAHFSSFEEHERYMKHRGMFDKGRSKGGGMSEQGLRDAENMVRERFSDKLSEK